VGRAYSTVAYQRARRRLLSDGAPCVHCGQPAAEADHQPPIATHRDTHADGSGCCELVPACGMCQRRQGGRLSRRMSTLRAHRRPAQPTPAPVLDPEGWPADDPVWDRATWLDALRDVPANATWPRLMTAPHPQATGSYGVEVAAYAEARTGYPWRWWQRLAATRLLECDDAGRLVWQSAALSMARQLGKSWLLADLAMWRLEHGRYWPAPDPPLVVHTGKDMAVCVEVQREARRWASQPSRKNVWKVRESNGQQTVEYLANGARWVVLASRAVQGRRACLAFVDEAWGVDARSVTEDLMPALMAQPSSQLVLVSSAHSKATDLMVGRRNIAAADLAATDALWIEWSTPARYDIGDEAGWRQASPHWDDERRTYIADLYAAALAGHDDADAIEDNPVTSFRTQYLNQWPTVKRRKGAGEPLLTDAAWQACRGALAAAPSAGYVAVEDWFGQGAAVAVAGTDGAGRFELDGSIHADRAAAFAEARRIVALTGWHLIVGQSLGASVPAGFPGRASMRLAGRSETARGLSLLRALVAVGAVVHDNTPDLDAQIGDMRVTPTPSGGLTIASSRRSDLLRAVLWALDAAQAPPPTPAVR
jgi:hypothetical protein